MGQRYTSKTEFKKVGGLIHQTTTDWEITPDGNTHHKGIRLRLLTFQNQIEDISTLSLLEEGLNMCVRVEDYKWALVYLQKIITLRIKSINKDHCE